MVDKKYNTKLKSSQSLYNKESMNDIDEQSLTYQDTIKRIPDNDVRAIFECLHENKPLPEHINFSIIHVGPNGQKLSPPSYEFKGTKKM